MKRRVLIDCDPGHGHALARVDAALHLDVVGVTTVFGKASVERTLGHLLA